MINAANSTCCEVRFCAICHNHGISSVYGITP
jgi:hypothetical protein